MVEGLYLFFTMEQLPGICASLRSAKESAEQYYSTLIRQGFSSDSSIVEEAMERYIDVSSAYNVFLASYHNSYDSALGMV